MSKVTKEQIQQWKDKHGDVYLIEIGEKAAYFREPDVKVWRFAYKALDTSTTAFSLALVKNSFLGGDEELISDEMFEDTAGQFQGLIDYEKAEYVRDGSHYVVTVGEKSCKLKPCTMQARQLADRDNPNNIPFKSEESLVSRLWIDGDEELKTTKHMRYFMPLMAVVKELREKHTASLKKL